MYMKKKSWNQCGRNSNLPMGEIKSSDGEFSTQNLKGQKKAVHFSNPERKELSIQNSPSSENSHKEWRGNRDISNKWRNLFVCLFVYDRCCYIVFGQKTAHKRMAEESSLNQKEKNW